MEHLWIWKVSYSNQANWNAKITNTIIRVLTKTRSYWKQKPREIWVKDEYKNNKFFHSSTLYRREQNAIMALQDIRGNWLFDRQQIGGKLCGIFKYIYLFYYSRPLFYWSSFPIYNHFGGKLRNMKITWITINQSYFMVYSQY